MNFSIRALIPENQLTCECAFYWRNVVQHVQNAGPEYDEQLDQVKPNCLHFCEYLQRYLPIISVYM